jgi:hypothetical protein
LKPNQCFLSVFTREELGCECDEFPEKILEFDEEGFYAKWRA